MSWFVNVLIPSHVGDPELLQRQQQREEARPAPLPKDCCSSWETTDTASRVFADSGCSKSPSPEKERRHRGRRVRPKNSLNSVLTKVQQSNEERTRRQSAVATSVNRTWSGSIRPSAESETELVDQFQAVVFSKRTLNRKVIAQYPV